MPRTAVRAIPLHLSPSDSSTSPQAGDRVGFNRRGKCLMEYQNPQPDAGRPPRAQAGSRRGARATAAPSFPKPPWPRLPASPPVRSPASIRWAPGRPVRSAPSGTPSAVPTMPAGVRAEVGETQVAVDISLVATYGTPAAFGGRPGPAAVYRAVEELVGLQVIEVNVGDHRRLRGRRRSKPAASGPPEREATAVNLTVVGIADGRLRGVHVLPVRALGLPGLARSLWPSEPSWAARRKGNWTCAASWMPSSAGAPRHELAGTDRAGARCSPAITASAPRP